MRSVAIVGGGASGVILAAHLLRTQDPDLEVTLVEKRDRVGQGVAYSTSHRDHTVNVPASGMSAFADDPDHFSRWLQHKGFAMPDGPWVFVPRSLYGTYLGELLSTVGSPPTPRLTILTADVASVAPSGDGVETRFASGESLWTDHAVLAVGHETQPARGRGLAIRAGSERDTPLDPDSPVMILGSGLSMVDAWLTLAHANHRGPILVVSRNGYLPTGHRNVAPLHFAASDIPFDSSLVDFLKWFRDRLDATAVAGGDWRSVVDALRPHSQAIWKSWPIRARRQFLSHVRPMWNVHRHRLPPELHRRMAEAVAAGQVKLVAAHLYDIEPVVDGFRATIRLRSTVELQAIEVARVYDCGGVSVDVAASSNPVIQNLVALGRGGRDPLHIGLDVTDECAVIDGDGRVTERLWAVGPLTRGRFFEIEAVPDIRVQCGEVADRLLKHRTRASPP